MHSGRAAKRDLGNDVDRGCAGLADLNVPGFGLAAAQWLIEKRDVVGIGVDTLSLDPGNSADFAVHFGFLPTNRYGVENPANLERVPARGGPSSSAPPPGPSGQSRYPAGTARSGHHAEAVPPTRVRAASTVTFELVPYRSLDRREQDALGAVADDYGRYPGRSAAMALDHR